MREANEMGSSHIFGDGFCLGLPKRGLECSRPSPIHSKRVWSSEAGGPFYGAIKTLEFWAILNHVSIDLLNVIQLCYLKEITLIVSRYGVKSLWQCFNSQRTGVSTALKILNLPTPFPVKIRRFL